MKSRCSASRRSFLLLVAGGLAGGCAPQRQAGPARAAVRDADTGPSSDATGCCGRRRRQSITDADSGPGADPIGQGRGRPAPPTR